MNILIISQDYPSISKEYAMSYVHTRNQYYDKYLNIEVLSFNNGENYIFEDIKVLNKESAIHNIENGKYNLLISHAPNLKNHVTFIHKYNKFFKKIILFIHGHEVLKLNDYYPKDYSFIGNKKKFLLQNLYDFLKLKVLKNLIEKLIKEEKLHCVFVSEWMKEEGMKNLDISLKEIENISSVIMNAANKNFLNKRYKFIAREKKADFITIRPLDQSKYGIDIVVNFAIKNPDLSFHIYGKGDFFKHNKKPDNVTVFNSFIQQHAIPDLLNKYQYALMPTRLDSQGVMNCEMASYGIPLITSNLKICREMLNDFPNVYYIENDKSDTYANFIKNIHLNENFKSSDKFSFENTVLKEIKLIKSMF